MQRFAAAALAFVLLGAGAPQLSSLDVGGRTRTYRVFVPASLPPRPALVVMLHGGFGNGAQAEAAYGWDALAARAGFVVLYPDGVGRAWNAGDCCGVPARDGIDDVAFVDAAVTAVARTYGTDPRRLYVTGMSNGAILAYRMACESTLRIAAIAPVAGALGVACAHPQALSLLHVHGLADRNVPFGGGVGTRAVVKVDHPPTSAALAVWRQADACGNATTTTGGTVTTTVWHCDGGRAVSLIAIAAAGHQWPGGRPMAPRLAALLGVDPPSTALNATETIWRFFAAHPSP